MDQFALIRRIAKEKNVTIPESLDHNPKIRCTVMKDNTAFAAKLMSSIQFPCAKRGKTRSARESNYYGPVRVGICSEMLWKAFESAWNTTLALEKQKLMKSAKRNNELPKIPYIITKRNAVTLCSRSFSEVEAHKIIQLVLLMLLSCFV